MNRFKSLVAIFAFSLLVLSLPIVASAQWRDNRRNDDYYGNGGYNRNLQGTIRNLKNRSERFERQIDRELDRSRYDGRRQEDRINDMARDFANAVERLDDEYDNRRDYNSSRDEAQRVLQLGLQLDRALSRGRLSYNVQNEWNRIRQDLQVISNAFGGYYNDNNNRNRRNRRNDDWRNRFPFPF
jgi:hypothetical protein